MSDAGPYNGFSFLPEVDVFAISDSTLYSATPISCCAEVAIIEADKGIIMPTPWHLSPMKARANLEGLCGWDGQHRMAKLGFELVKNGLAKPGGNVANDASDRSAD
jgi:hypothetical protein